MNGDFFDAPSMVLFPSSYDTCQNTTLMMFTSFVFMPQDLATSLTKFKNKLDTVSRQLSSTSAENENLRQQVCDLKSLMKGVVKLVLSKQQELRAAVEKMVKIETALLNRRDFEGKLQEWSQLVNDVEEFVKHLGPFNEDEKDLELLYYEVREIVGDSLFWSLALHTTLLLSHPELGTREWRGYVG